MAIARRMHRASRGQDGSASWGSRACGRSRAPSRQGAPPLRPYQLLCRCWKERSFRPQPEPSRRNRLDHSEESSMELKMPTPEQAYWGLRAMKTVALADGALDEAEQQMLTSIQTILGTNHPVQRLAGVTAAELASALADRQIRHQLVQGLIVVSLIDGNANARETEAVEQFAQALDVNAPEVRDLR